MKRTAPRWCPERQQRRPGHPARRRLSRSRGTFRKTPCSARRAHLPENTPLPARSQTCFEGPFGELLRATGPMAKANPFRFSTKYQDDETDLIYYGCRYFGPSAGRWISRDPIEELGEQNLYDFCANNPTHYVDRDGRAIWRDPTDVNAPHTVSWPALQNESTFPYGAVAHGSMWLIGALGNTNVISGLDPMAEEAKKMPEVDYVRRMWQVRLRAHGCHPGMSPINVLRHAGSEPQMEYVPGIVLDLVWRNRTHAYLGSYRGTSSIRRCFGCCAVVVFTIDNVLSWSSASRLPPPFGYSVPSAGSVFDNWLHPQFQNVKSILSDNFLGPFGKNVNMTITWEESICP